MTITILEASNYFKGLLLLIRKDRRIADAECELMKRIGKSLGFEEEFCATAIEEILENVHIVDEVPCFSRKELAKKFIKDGIALAFADGEGDSHEHEWLRLAAEKNGLETGFLTEEWNSAEKGRESPVRLEAEDLTVRHS